MEEIDIDTHAIEEDLHIHAEVVEILTLGFEDYIGILLESDHINAERLPDCMWCVEVKRNGRTYWRASKDELPDRWVLGDA